ncbi:MAG: DegV family protein [Bacillota bacterium]|nr:DegV family protein [Bacillota bacterium]
MRIITDSGSDIRLEKLQELHIDLVPLNITYGQETILDDKTKDMDEFWKIMETENLKTSQPAPAAYLDVFEDVKAKGEEAICICFTSALSGTYSTAVMAKNMVDYDKIHVIDTRTGSLAQALNVYHACKLRDQGASAQEIVESVEAFKHRTRLFACIDTLEYLARGGRMPAKVSSLGDFMKVKLIVSVNEEGKLAVEKMKRGKKKAMKEMVDLFNSVNIDPNYPIIPIYTKDRTNCEELMAQIGAHADYEEIGCTIGCHAGPNVFGFVYVTKE